MKKKRRVNKEGQSWRSRLGIGSLRRTDSRKALAARQNVPECYSKASSPRGSFLNLEMKILEEVVLRLRSDVVMMRDNFKAARQFSQ